jgi:lipoprotein LprG
MATAIRRTGALVAAAALALSACSGDEPEVEEQTATQAPTAEDRLEQARVVLTEAGSVALTLTGSDLPEDVDSLVISAEGSGTMEPPAFEGTITAKVQGIQAEVPTVAVDDQLYVQLPFTPGYITTTPEDLNVPDPARLFDPEAGVVSLLSQTEGAAFGEQTRQESEILQQVSGTLPGQAIVDLLNVGDADASFEVVYGLVEESWEVRTVSITGPFYPPATSTYALTLDAYGEPVEVTAP